VAVEAIPEIAIGKGDDFVTADQMTTYRQYLQKAKNKSVELLMEKVFGNSTEIDKAMFTRLLKDGPASSIINSHELRKYLVENYKKFGDSTLKGGSLAIKSAFRKSLMKKPAAAPAATEATS
jgi:flavorubredoxin